jgi:aldehyde:ferredoxin oxidoreductase
MYGFAGKILRVDLTREKVSSIDTADYAEWGGGHGVGSALFWDIVVGEKRLDLEKLDGFDPDNLVTLMTSPLSGTMTPAGSARTEVQGIGVQSSPIGWFTRSNFGGRFAPMLKFAGWDGIAIEGAADEPVWLDIRDGEVEIRRCADIGLWGTDTWECQRRIWETVARDEQGRYGEWLSAGEAAPARTGRTTQRPAVLAAGPAGENLGRVACLIHDAGHGSGQGGFGAVFGSKNLKAVSVLGTGGIEIADPEELLEARLWAQRNYCMDIDTRADPEIKWRSWFARGIRPQNLLGKWDRSASGRIAACVGCHIGCKERNQDGLGNESACTETAVFGEATRAVSGADTDAQKIGADLLQKYGINAYEAEGGLWYLYTLHSWGLVGPGKVIDCDLDFGKLGTVEFIEAYLGKFAFQEDEFGKTVAQGYYRAAATWGRREADLKTGLLEYPYWGIPEHQYDPRAEVYWGYGSILGDRDANEHCFNYLYWWRKRLDAAEVVPIVAERLLPYQNNTAMLDFSTDNIYSEDMARLTAWHRHYTRFWKQSALYCDQRWPDFHNTLTEDRRGLTPEGEPRFYNAVTGRDLTFVDGMELGRKIWNLDNAIWVLQGRHRDMVRFADYIHEMPYGQGSGPKEFTFSPGYRMPGRDADGNWTYVDVNNRVIDREKFERFKTRYYELEGWDPATGYPTAKTLSDLGLGAVADELRARGRLGS